MTTTGFRGIAGGTLRYRIAGSFMLHRTKRFGLPTVLNFFRTNNCDETLDAIRARVQSVFGVTPGGC